MAQLLIATQTFDVARGFAVARLASEQWNDFLVLQLLWSMAKARAGGALLVAVLIIAGAADAHPRARQHFSRAWAFEISDAGTIIGSRPSGCPHAYCGCALRKYLGLEDTRLNLARNWSRLFSHESSPRAGLAAVRNHHVLFIEGSAAHGWLVRDYNSGGGLSRVHVRDLRGYVFVDPSRKTADR